MVQGGAYWLGTALMVTLLTIGGPRAAIGQAPDVQDLLDQGREAGANVEQIQTAAERARQSGLNTQATVSLLRPAIELAKQDLPTDPLLSKTLEGLSKQVPPSRMQPVLQQYRTHTEQAGQLVGQWTQRPEVREFLGMEESSQGRNPQLVTAITKAQQQELSVKNIEALLNDLPTDVSRRPVSPNEVAAAVDVMAELPGNRSSAKTAQQLLTSALNAGYTPESLQQLPSALQSAHQKSNRPVDALAQGTARAIAQGSPATQVLQSLFQGSFPGGGPPADIGKGPSGNKPGSGKPPDPGPPENSGPPENPPGGSPPDAPDGSP